MSESPIFPAVSDSAPGLASESRTRSCPRCRSSLAGTEPLSLCPTCGAVTSVAIAGSLMVARIVAAAGAVGLILGLLAVFMMGAPGRALGGLLAVWFLACGGAVAWSAHSQWKIVKSVGKVGGPHAERFLGRLEQAAWAGTAGLAVVALLAGWFVFVSPLSSTSRVEAAFAGRIDQFLNYDIDPFMAPEEGATPPSPTLKGKVLIVVHESKSPHLPRGSIPAAHYELPAEIRAERPEDVGTVVWVDVDARQTHGDRSTGAKGYTLFCDLSVIHVVQPPVLAGTKKKLQGGDPPRETPRGQAGYGPLPTASIVDFVTRLPRK